MGWDVLVFKLKNPSTSTQDLDADKCLPLGDDRALRGAIDAVLSGVDWTDPTWGLLRLPECSLEFNIKSDDRLSIGIHVHGGGDPVTPIVALCKAQGWAAFDTTTAEWIDLERPSAQGWDGFRAFRDRVVGSMKGEGDV